MSRRAKPPSVLWSKHRVEALTDGIFAVAMTLLVIELKLPDPHTIHSYDELTRALLSLTPKAISWLISFFVLATFWISHHRLFHYVRSVDATLLWLNLVQLGFVSLMPFSAALVGEFGATPLAQIAYNGNMVMLGLMGLMKLQHVRRHPELTGHPMKPGTYHASLLRLGGLIACGMSAILIARTNGALYATLIYLAMIPIGRYGRYVEAKAHDATQHDGESDPTPAVHP